VISYISLSLQIGNIKAYLIAKSSNQYNHGDGKMKKTKTQPKKKNVVSSPQKSNQATKKTISTKEEKAVMEKHQKAAIVFAASAIFLACVAFIKGYNVWTYLHEGILGLFGICAYLWPVMLVYIAVVFAFEKPIGSIFTTLLGISVFIVFIGGTIHLVYNQSDYLQYEPIGVQIVAEWGKRASSPVGGVFGAMIGGALSKLFGKTGALITILLSSTVILLFVTRTTLTALVRVVKRPVDKVSAATAAKKERTTESNEPQNISTAGKPFNPPKVLDDSEISNDIITGASKGEPVLVVPVKPMAEEHSSEIDFSQVEISIPSFLNNKEPKPPATTNFDDIISSQQKSKKDAEKKSLADNIKVADIEDEYKSYKLPPVDCLSPTAKQNNAGSDEELRVNGQKLIDTLKSFGIQAKILMISRGPSVTRYELQPNAGIRISRITKLADDIALNLAATSVRIEAPIPNKAAIGVEIPNRIRSNVSFREIIETEQFRSSKSKLNIALGKDITGNVICADLDKMPHLLIAGTTGSGKSVCMNSIIVSLLFNATPDEVKLLLIDAKRGVELGPYNGIAHLAVPVVEDSRKAAGALSWAVTEVDNRYKLFNEKKVRDISAFNELADKTDDMKKLHRIVVFIDELNDLMMLAPHEVEESICRLAQMARAAGIHLVIATQRPSVDVITGVIKANIPSRIALSVASYVDSRTIIDTNGAEKLLGNGDMLFSPVGVAKPVRIQGCYISNKDIERTVKYIKSQTQAAYDEEIIKDIASRAVEAKKKGAANATGEDGEREDEMLTKAIEVVVDSQVASTTFLQRKLKLGYARAANLIDTLEQRHIVGPSEGSKPRKVLVSKQQWMEIYAMNQDDVTGSENE
jgi:DNA segregation ATPase FtsK/SpoIIIE, S-DNA-T family